MKRVIPLALFVAACTPATQTAPPAAAGPTDAAAPSWAQRGDTADAEGHRFICHGEGTSEEQAYAAANALCDDKLCKLCGVEIESVLRTHETLTGVEVQRDVVERCRRVRQVELKPLHKSIDCGATGCTAWLELAYSETARATECKRRAEESFADPAACQAAIDAFRAVSGYSAASFRERVSIMDRALSACSSIDVRPTPLMQSLDEKLHAGMTNFRGSGPSYLRNYWLADYAPMWQQYRESPSFVERLQLLRGYLAHKVLLLEVIEAAVVEREELDTKPAVEKMLRAMRAVSAAEAYGVGRVQFFALDAVCEAARAGQFSADSEALNVFMRAAFAPESLNGFSEMLLMTKLFALDGRIDNDEWQYVLKVHDWPRAVSEVLAVPNHVGGDRRKRFRAALDKVLEGTASKDRFARVKSILPYGDDAVFVLDMEKELPAGITYDWEFLADVLNRNTDDLSRADHDRLVVRMTRALAALPADVHEQEHTCLALAERLQLLETHGGSIASLGDVICTCLTGPLAAEGSRVLVNKSRLYERALREELRCVSPRS